jgi:hypothetical protein
VKLCRAILIAADSDHVVAPAEDVADGMAGGVDPNDYNRNGPRFGTKAPHWPTVPDTGRVIPMERGINAGAKDPTAAERKRRQRERDRQRDTGRDAPVTVRDDLPLTPEFEPAG